MNIIYYDKLPSSLKNINFDFCIINLKYKKNIKSAIKRLSRWKHNQRKIMKTNKHLIKCAIYYNINEDIFNILQMKMRENYE